MTFNDYADELNAHADQCEQCALCRKCNTTLDMCAVGQAIKDRWQAAATEALKDIKVL